ncbi:ubiquitin-conjugating enzyme E2 Q2 [Hirsutella rhossiliensis]|uniref:Ubiquitin-conjugating enzyme E2 Q2 n=1 Tax=Hirsutella rhossiliensis TaxID=111463 RepID=A0A9P8MUN5_9HYPO|nr:ubiquitin-conjugating enzyme E2 Q2 [Hirsutella rhossiliensis]KAH0960764.1 ubiquitin-conjugating enzyme E2 Q2 [Hirsutella rhossiliensis]
MSLKRFYHDLALAKRAQFDNVSNIRKGELNDSIAFTFAHPDLESPVDVEFVIHDVADYLTDAKFMVLTSSDSLQTTKLADFLQALSARIPRNSTVGDIVLLVSNRLATKMESGAQSSESEGFDGLDIDDDFFSDTNMDDELDDEADIQMTPADPFGTLVDRHRIEMLKKSLQETQSAGLCLGLFPAVPARMPEAVSLSIRVSQLGLPDDTLEAWDLKYLELSAEQELVRFRFGKCAAAKPSMDSVCPIVGSRYTESNPGETDNCIFDSSGFLPTCMSASINRLLNQCLHRLIALRRGHGLSWTAAQEAMQAMEQGSAFRDPTSRGDRADEAIIGPRAPTLLGKDFAVDCEEHFSIPLVAMQVALRQFVRCTEFCMVCYGKLDHGPGSLKPYVCAKPLCLYQYLSLGFGPSVEHEIINSPHVVDLLISFFYSAVWNDRLREFPTGLPLKVPDFQEPAKSIAAQVQLKDNTIRIRPDHSEAHQAIKSGDFVALFTSDVRSEFFFPFSPQTTVTKPCAVCPSIK